MRILITGMPGTGKSTMIAELARRGYRVADLDAPGYSHLVPANEGEQKFDADGGVTIRYSARVLDAYHGDNLISWYEEQDDPQRPSQFDQVSLFIDDCPDLAWCVGATDPGGSWAAGLKNYGPIPGGPYGVCWSWEFGDGRNPCSHSQQELADKCNNAYPVCKGTCDSEMGQELHE